MNLEDLQSTRSRERRTDSLQSLPDSFYDDAAAFVRELRARREEVAAEADDPFDSPDVRRLTNSIKTAENTVEAIYERRVGKVVKLASLDAAGMTAAADGLTPEEHDLFGTLVAAIEHNRRDVIEGLGTTDADDREAGNVSERDTDPTASGERANAADERQERSSEPPMSAADEGIHDRAPNPPAEDADPLAADAQAADPRATDAMGAADAMGAPTGTASGESNPDPDREPTSTVTADGVGPERTASTSAPSAAAAVNDSSSNGADGSAPRTETTEGDTTDRETIRITRDVGEIVGIDERVYELSSEDVVTLPAANAKPLVDRNAAERLE